MSKRFVSDCLKGFAPDDLVEEFYSHYDLDEDSLLQEIYNASKMTQTLSGYVYFLHEHDELPYVKHLIYDSIEEFIRCILGKLMKDGDTVYLVGWVAELFAEQFRVVCGRHDIRIGNICESPIRGLLHFHLKN